MKRISIVLLVCAMFALPSAVRADVAPPINPPGPNLQPGAETQVRMAAETVLIDQVSAAARAFDAEHPRPQSALGRHGGFHDA